MYPCKALSDGLQKPVNHRVDRVPGFLSNRSNWVCPPPHPQANAVPPPSLVPGGGGGYSLAGELLGGPNSDEGTDTEEL
jgi:hypothetical protein